MKCNYVLLPYVQANITPLGQLMLDNAKLYGYKEIQYSISISSVCAISGIMYNKGAYDDIQLQNALEAADIMIEYEDEDIWYLSHLLERLSYNTETNTVKYSINTYLLKELRQTL